MKALGTVYLFIYISLGALALGYVIGYIVITRPKIEPVAIVHSPFIYSFNVDGILHESSSLSLSSSPYFWMNSGGMLIINGSVGSTIQQELDRGDKWQRLYAKNNSLDTDGGVHPQNLFRLVTKSRWDNMSEQVQFYIADDNFSNSPNRNASNGLLLMSRYRDDGQTLYYAGIRVDGLAVIKKKYQGTYYTMAEKKIFSGIYDREGGTKNKNLLPHNEWIGLRLHTVTQQDGTVLVTLFMERDGGAWERILSATDTGKNFGDTTPITGPSFAGIRTDFMDVEFDSYRIENI